MPEQEISPAVAVGEVSKKLLRILAIEKSGFVDDYLNVNVMGGIVQIKRGLVPADALKNMDNWQLEETLSGNGPIKDPQYRFVRKKLKIRKDYYKKMTQQFITFFGFLTLIIEIIVVIDMIDHIIDSPYWSLGLGIIWLLFLASMGLFIKGSLESKIK